MRETENSDIHFFCLEKHHDKQTLIFPNQGDAQAHNFTKDCPWDTDGGLCVCPSGYTFDEASRSCGKWKKELFICVSKDLFFKSKSLVNGRMISLNMVFVHK